MRYLYVQRGTRHTDFYPLFRILQPTSGSSARSRPSWSPNYKRRPSWHDRNPPPNPTSLSPVPLAVNAPWPHDRTLHRNPWLQRSPVCGPSLPPSPRRQWHTRTPCPPHAVPAHSPDHAFCHHMNSRQNKGQQSRQISPPEPAGSMARHSIRAWAGACAVKWSPYASLQIQRIPSSWLRHRRCIFQYVAKVQHYRTIIYTLWWRRNMECFPHCQHIVRGKANNTELWWFYFVDSSHKLSNKQASCRWFETPCFLSDVTMMCTRCGVFWSSNYIMWLEQMSLFCWIFRETMGFVNVATMPEHGCAYCVILIFRCMFINLFIAPQDALQLP